MSPEEQQGDYLHIPALAAPVRAVLTATRHRLLAKVGEHERPFAVRASLSKIASLIGDELLAGELVVKEVP